MTEGESNSRQAQKKLIIVLTVLTVLGFSLVMALVISSSASHEPAPSGSDAYAEALKAAMTGADAAIGERLANETDCAACHLTGDGSAAPLFAGLASVAGARRPPLNAEQYLYEAIVFPAAHLVDGYADAMPNDYGERFALADLGHMIAYLLTLTDGEGEA